MNWWQNKKLDQYHYHHHESSKSSSRCIIMEINLFVQRDIVKLTPSKKTKNYVDFGFIWLGWKNCVRSLGFLGRLRNIGFKKWTSFQTWLFWASISQTSKILAPLMFAWVTPLAAAGDTSKLPPTAAERISLSSVQKSSSSGKNRC